MDPNFKKRFNTICSKMKSVLPGSSVWELDDRFNTVVAAFERNSSEIIFSALKASFSQEWSKKTVRKAPAHIKSIADSISGIETGQIVFTTTPLTPFTQMLNVKSCDRPMRVYYGQNNFIIMW